MRGKIDWVVLCANLESQHEKLPDCCDLVHDVLLRWIKSSQTYWENAACQSVVGAVRHANMAKLDIFSGVSC